MFVMRLTRPMIIGVALSGCLLGAVAGGMVYASADSPPSQLAAPYVVRNASGTEALSVQLQQGVRNTGSFDFSVAGVGDWTGVVTVAPVSARISHLKGTITGLFEATGTTTAAAAAVRMEGEIDQSHNSATINVWVSQPGHPGQAHYLLQTGSPPNASQAPGVAQQALTALQEQQWPAVYQMAASSVTDRYTQDQFVQAMSGQQEPSMSSASFAGNGSITVVSGISYYTQPITFTTGVGGSATTYTASVVLVWEMGQWRFAGTSEPQPSS
jgi:hypothetical protein